MRRLVVLILGFTLVLFAPPRSVSAQNTIPPKDIVRAIIDLTYNQGNVAAMNAVFTPDYIRNPGKLDLKAAKISILSLRAAVPDLKATVNLLITDTTWVAVRLKLEGTFKNELVFPNSMPVPPNNQPIKLWANIIYRFNDKGQIVEEWDGFDDLSYLAQINVIPPPEVVTDIVQDTLGTVSDGTQDRNKDLIKRYFDGLNQGNYSLIQDQFRSDLNAYDSFGKLDRTGLIADRTSLRAAFPDLAFTVNQLIGQGNWVGVLATLHGTFTANYVTTSGTSIAPTGKPVELLIITFFRFDEQGQVMESWELYDSWSFVSQLGLTTPAK